MRHHLALRIWSLLKIHKFCCRYRQPNPQIKDRGRHHWRNVHFWGSPGIVQKDSVKDNKRNDETRTWNLSQQKKVDGLPLLQIWANDLWQHFYIASQEIPLSLITPTNAFLRFQAAAWKRYASRSSPAVARNRLLAILPSRGLKWATGSVGQTERWKHFDAEVKSGPAEIWAPKIENTGVRIENQIKSKHCPPVAVIAPESRAQREDLDGCQQFLKKGYIFRWGALIFRMQPSQRVQQSQCRKRRGNKTA